ELVPIGRKLTGADGGFACVLCHAIGDQPPLAVFEVQGIDLALSGDRLRRSWFERWLWDPPRIDPSSKMPRYADQDGKTAFRDVFDGDAGRQFEAIWHFLRSID
ncbi:MAG: hypothetical protein KDB80_12315, partial [Planctomycetes bacterium]|nr:hypothetical protein [Planctomycetota bacterium]